MEKGDYRLFEELSSASNTNCISLNLTHKNPVLNKAFNDIKQFRIALSHAINRQEVIDTVYLRAGLPQHSRRQMKAPSLYRRDLPQAVYRVRCREGQADP